MTSQSEASGQLIWDLCTVKAKKANKNIQRSKNFDEIHNHFPLLINSTLL